MILGNKLLLGTNNNDKLKELSAYFAEHKIDIQLLTPKDFGLAEPKETETTFEGNAKLKAKYYGDKTGLICLADDSGVCIHELNGEPGVYTADWAGPNKDFQVGMDRVRDELLKVGVDPNTATAKFVSVLALYTPEQNQFQIFSGEIEGSLNFDFRDTPGFGFQPIFIPIGSNKCYAMMTDAEKKICGSHRMTSFKKFLDSCFSHTASIN